MCIWYNMVYNDFVVDYLDFDYLSLLLLALIAFCSCRQVNYPYNITYTIDKWTLSTDFKLLPSLLNTSEPFKGQ